MTRPLVTFGIVNCNRLHYLRSCFESLYDTTADYREREFIVVDNASTETGTDAYLTLLEVRGVKVVRNAQRDPANEFAKGLNTICELAQGEFIAPLQGDMQFTVIGWLPEYVKFYQQTPDTTGCMAMDAQRRIRHIQHSPSMSEFIGPGRIKFSYDSKRPPFSGAGDVLYSRKWVQKFYPWNIKNQNHEGTLDSETSMLQKSLSIREAEGINIFCAVPSVPVSIAIYTDARGTNARVRGNKRYGDYWPPKIDYRYYELQTIDEAVRSAVSCPASIEEVAKPIGWSPLLDRDGNWLKNPIRPETALPGDAVDI
jgi:glycosyltransferase involved in cell wall biosynthesis